MISSPLPCFHSVNLRDKFARQLETAASQAQVTPEQAATLRHLCDMPWAPDQDLRFDALESPGIDHPELADAILISSRSLAFKEVYLCSPITGVECHDSRHALKLELEARYASAREPLSFEASLLDTPIFEHWMRQIMTRLDRHAQYLDTHLAQLPRVQDIIARQLDATLTEWTAQAASDGRQWIFQVLHAPAPAPAQVEADADIPADAHTPTILTTRSLLEAGMDRYCAVGLPTGQTLRLVNSQGQALPPEQSSNIENALNRALEQLGTPYEQALDRYWQASPHVQVSRTDYAGRILRHHFYMALMQAADAETIALPDLRLLCQVSRPGRASAGGTYVHVETIGLLAGQHNPTALNATLAISFDIPLRKGLYFYSPAGGLQPTEDQQSLGALIKGQLDTLQASLALDDWQWLPAEEALDASLSSIDGDVFSHQVETLRTLQKRNLTHALAQPRPKPSALGPMLDDALDLRGLLMPGLMRLEGSLRWPPSPPAPSPAAPESAGASTGIKHIAALRQTFERTRTWLPDIETCAHRLLDLQLMAFGPQAPLSRQIKLYSPTWARSAATEAVALKAVSAPLVDVLLEQLAGNRELSLPEDLVIGDENNISHSGLSRSLLDIVLERARDRLHAYWAAMLQAATDAPLRLGTEQVDLHCSGVALRQALYREEIALAALQPAGEQWLGAWIKQVLDLPLASMRRSLAGQMIEVHSLAIQPPDSGPPIPLSNMVVLNQVQAPEGQTVLCSHLYGIGDYPSWAEMTRQLSHLMQTRGRRLHSLQLVAQSHQPRLLGYFRQSPQSPLVFTSQPLAISLAEYTQRSEEQRQLASAAAAFVRGQAAGMSAQAFKAYVSSAASAERLSMQLDELEFNLHASNLEKELPEWVFNATSAELQDYLEHLGRLLTTLQAKRSFLSGIAGLHKYAHAKVKEAVSKDFPDLDIDGINVKAIRHATTGAHWSAGTQGLVPWGAGQRITLLDMSLVDYCIHRAIALPEKHLELKQSTGEDLPILFNSLYVKELATDLDIGANYITLLEKTFRLNGQADTSEPGDDYRERLSLFQLQVPPVIIQSALEAHLKGSLSKANLLCVEALLNMPDALARQRVDGYRIQIWPLQLVATPTLPADQVDGVFLIGPAPSESRPIVLLATFNTTFTLRQFDNEAHLEEQLLADAELSALVLSRVSPSVLSRYQNGGLKHPHFPAAVGPDPTFPVSLPRTALAFNPVAGNAQTYLFEQALAFFVRLAKADVVTNAQADAAANEYLITLLRDTSLSLVGGRLSWVVAAWQSGEWLKSSASSLAAGNRSQAVSETAVAITSLLTHRRPRLQRLEPAKPEPRYQPAHDFSFERNRFPKALQSQLRSLEARNVQLRYLQRDSERDLYTDPINHRDFAAIDGNVYEVRERDGAWEIFSGERSGPQIRRHANGLWELDTSWLRGGGAFYSREQSSGGGTWKESDVATRFSVTAAGMAAIRRSDLRRAIDITEAQEYALRQLTRSRKALKTVGPSRLPNHQTQALLNDFFGTQQPDRRIIERVSTRIDALLSEFGKRSLKGDGKRYVMGRLLSHADTGVATTFIGDPYQRLFLAERFFEVPAQWQAPPLLPQYRFDGKYAFRCAALIHEMTHQLFNTEDILYLWPHSPFREMIDASTPRGARLLASMDRQLTGLSHLTPKAQLFTNRQNRSKTFTVGDRQHTAILEETGGSTLEDARTLFLTDPWVRAKVMLRNADSLTLLIKLLAGPAP